MTRLTKDRLGKTHISAVNYYPFHSVRTVYDFLVSYFCVPVELLHMLANTKLCKLKGPTKGSQ